MAPRSQRGRCNAELRLQPKTSIGGQAARPTPSVPAPAPCAALRYAALLCSRVCASPGLVPPRRRIARCADLLRRLLKTRCEIFDDPGYGHATTEMGRLLVPQSLAADGAALDASALLLAEFTAEQVYPPHSPRSPGLRCSRPLLTVIALLVRPTMLARLAKLNACSVCHTHDSLTHHSLTHHSLTHPHHSPLTTLLTTRYSLQAAAELAGLRAERLLTRKFRAPQTLGVLTAAAQLVREAHAAVRSGTAVVDESQLQLLLEAIAEVEPLCGGGASAAADELDDAI